MLISTRTVEESIYIGEDIQVTILDIKKQEVKLGIDAPRDRVIYHEDTHQRIHNNTASKSLSNHIDTTNSVLIMGRCEGESIMVSDDIEIKIEAIKENKVIIAIHAPRDILVCRKEHYLSSLLRDSEDLGESSEK